jgi:molecular chaperone HscB
MKNYFEIFTLPANFALDEIALEKKYLEFQKTFHPDNSSSGDALKAIEINEAYKILADDFLRICYLLQLKGIDILNNEKAVKVDFATLEEQLELQEKISEIENKEEIEMLQKQLKLETKELIAIAVKLFEASDLALCAQKLIKCKYLKKSLEDLKIKKKK